MSATVIVVVAPLPWTSETVAGVAESVKPDAAVTVTLTTVVCVELPLVAVTVTA